MKDRQPSAPDRHLLQGVNEDGCRNVDQDAALLLPSPPPAKTYSVYLRACSRERLLAALLSRPSVFKCLGCPQAATGPP